MTEQRPLITAPTPLKLRIADYLALEAAGMFDDYAKTELIEGTIYVMNAQHRPHARIKMKLYDALRDALVNSGSPLVALVEAGVAMPDHSLPEPDIALTREPDGDGFIPLSSVDLIIEVSDTSLRTDLGRKLKLYARKGVAEYWVADVKGRVIHQFWSPRGAAYAERGQIAFGDPISAQTIDGLQIATASL